MNGLKSIARGFNTLFEASDYPKEFLEEYDLIECLAYHQGRETLLVQRKSDGVTAITSCYDCAEYPFSTDLQFLGELDHPGLPRYYGRYSNNKKVCLVREYIDGVTLNAYVTERQLPLEEIIEKMTELCDILELLHSHKPQIVHRDIKPENIIVRPNGKIALIDFDIARTVKEGGETDTVFFGTKVYAPPEQYGFGQTDSRADIYSFGVLLRWMVTGSARKNPNVSAIPEIEKIIDRCTAFAPDRRYNDISEVKRALGSIKPGQKHVSIKSLILCTVVAVAMLAVGFTLGKCIKFDDPPQSITFREPLIEQAVRLMTGKEDGDLTEEDISGVTALYIYGDRAFDDPGEFYRCTIDTSTEGSVHTLDDIGQLPGLRELHIVNQGYVDASGLSGHSKLNTLELKHMRLSNVSAVAGVPNLKEAVLFDDGLSDVTALQNCLWLETLDIGLNDIKSLEKVGRYPNVKNLGLMWLEMDSVDDIADCFPKLRSIMLEFGKFKDLSGLKKLEKLETVNVRADQADEVTGILTGTNISINISEN